MLLIEGHSQKQLHGVTCNPQFPDEFATVGDDGVLRIWSLSRRLCLRRLALECAARSVAWSPNGTVLVVGVGGDPTLTTKDGAFMVIHAQALEVVFEDRKAKQWISDIKYSKSGLYLAIASIDGKVYLHDGNNYSFQRTVEMPSKASTVKAIDFSDDSDFLRISTNQEELYYFSMAAGEMIASPASVRDVKWASHNCPFTWLSQGNEVYSFKCFAAAPLSLSNVISLR
jgi:WD40 repeat protein